MTCKTESVWCLVVMTGLLPTVGTARSGEQDGPPLAVSPFDAQTAKTHQEAWAEYMGQPIELTNSIGMKLILLPPGEFQMGSSDSAPWAYASEKPQHRVRITKSFRLGVYEVTQAEYQRVVGTNPSFFKASGGMAPVERVSWDDALTFCRKLSSLANEQTAGREYRLPTEAEWEFACRAGSQTKYCFGDDENTLKEYAWCGRISGAQTHPVGEKKPNGWGLYDMHGNVSEWCADEWEYTYYRRSPIENPLASSSYARVFRGGSCLDGSKNCRSAYRDGIIPGDRVGDRGFRVVLRPSGE